MTVEELVDELLEFDLESEVMIAVQNSNLAVNRILDWFPVSLVSQENYNTDKDTVSIYTGERLDV